MRLIGITVPFTTEELQILLHARGEDLNEINAFQNLHPQGVYLFIKLWSFIANGSVWFMRLPFVLSSIAALLFIYKIGQRFFNDSVALFVIAILATSQLSISTGQFVDVSGFSFAILCISTWFWLNYMFTESSVKNLAVYLLVAAIGMYCHYFIVLATFLQLVASIFIIKPGQLKIFVPAAILLLLTFLPNFSLFQSQFSNLDLGEVYQRPSQSFLVDYGTYLLNHSFYFIFVVLALTSSGLFRAARPNNTSKTISYLFAGLFVLSYLILHFVSNASTSVLHPKLMIFSTPFLLYALLSRTDAWEPKWKVLFAVILILAGTLTLTLDKRYYNVYGEHGRSVLKSDIADFNSEDATIQTILSIESPQFLNDELKNESFKKSILSFCADSLSISELIVILNKCKSEKIHYAWVKKEPSPEFLDVLLSYYPKILSQRMGDGFESFLLAKSEQRRPDTAYTQIFYQLGITKDSNWIKNFEDHVETYDGTYKLTSNFEFFPLFDLPLDSIDGDYNHLMIRVQMGAVSLNVKKSALICFEVLNEYGQQIYYKSNNLNQYLIKNEQWRPLSLTARIEKKYLKNKKNRLRIFFWNKDSQEVHFNYVQVFVHKGNPLLYSKTQAY